LTGNTFLVGKGSAPLQAIPAERKDAPHPIDPSVDKWFFISGSSA